MNVDLSLAGLWVVIIIWTLALIEAGFLYVASAR